MPIEQPPVPAPAKPLLVSLTINNLPWNEIGRVLEVLGQRGEINVEVLLEAPR